MKRRLFLIVLLFVSVLASAQSQKVKFDSKGTFTLSEVFRQVERQTNMTIAYNESSISVERMVSLDSGTYTVQEVMNQVLAGTGMEMAVQGNIIAIVQAEKEQVYSGVVRDELAPIIGAVVMVDGDNSTAVITGMDGEFSVCAKEGSMLNVSILGYNDANVVLGSKVNGIDIVLTEDTQLIDEVVVDGYGTTKKVNLTGAVSVIKSDDLQDRSALSASKMLQGSVPGLNITSRSGRPGQSASINIRGLNSINGGSPLVLIDGAEGDLERINPADIESISVNSWEHRRPASIAMLKEQMPDIFGLQEALDFQVDYLQDNLPVYANVGVGRDDGVAKGERMAIFYNTERVELLDWGTYWLSETPDVPSKGWDAAYPRCATWSKMRLKDSGKEFFYVNTHLDHQGAESQRKGLDMIVSKIAEMNPAGLPMVLTGDFNVEPENPVLDELDSRMLSARTSALESRDKATFNGWGSRAIIIDYIYHSGFSHCPEYEVLDRSYDSVPYISDHYPVMTRLKF